MADQTAKISHLIKKLEPVKLMVVTKHRSTETIRTVTNTPARYLGENRVTEIQRKYSPELLDRLKERNIELHFIGHLQTNKVKLLLPYVSAIQSVDSLKLAKKINDESLHRGQVTTVYLQVNLTEEPQKYGFKKDELMQCWSTIQFLQSLQVRGLMCMGKDGDPKVTRTAFKTCRYLTTQLNLPECSMGMSDDLNIAVQEGSTMVRIGRSLFEDEEVVIQ